METEEESSPAKASKLPSTQEVPTTTPSYPDWSPHMQAFYPSGAAQPPFFPTPVASPATNPYNMWGGQHHMPPYGTPVQYMYSPGAVYNHPNIAMTTNSVQTSVELEGKGPEGKGQPSVKKSKGASASVGKATEVVRAISDSGNDGASQSTESGSEGSADGSDENANQQQQELAKKGSFNQMLAEGANSQNTQSPVSAKPVGSVPATNLNIGIELWPANAGGAKMGPNPTGAASAVVQHDERELKRQKRKQSNRESARRSRLRKQAECDELQQRVEALNNEHRSLQEVKRMLAEDCAKLASENNSIQDELKRLGVFVKMAGHEH